MLSISTTVFGAENSDGKDLISFLDIIKKSGFETIEISRHQNNIAARERQIRASGLKVWSIHGSLGGGATSAKKSTLSIIDIFMPHGKTLPAILELLRYTEKGFKTDFEIKENIYDDGVIFEEEGFKVTAWHNNHLAPMDGKYISYSFLIEADGKSVVYSGDVRSVKDIEPLINNTDLIIMETGHHLPEDVCKYLTDSDKKLAKLAFAHHGRTILEDFDGELKKCKKIMGNKVFIATDGMTYEL
jgi:ribonuclease BN (tRNA processing enzyme)